MNSNPPASETEEYVTVEFAGVPSRFWLPNRAVDHIQRLIAAQHKFYESEMLEHMHARIAPGQLVLDVGANIGNHTVFLANVCRARVISLEPNREAYDLLARNVELNDLSERVDLRLVAAGREPGRGRLIDEVPGNLGQARVDVSGDGEVTVQRIDDLELPDTLAAIKVDVEGAELDVLMGAEATLLRDRPLLYVECATQNSLGLVAEYLAKLGFSANAHFNATTTVLFRPVAAGALEVNQQMALFQHEMQGRFQNAYRTTSTGFRRLHEDLQGETKTLRGQVDKSQAAHAKELAMLRQQVEQLAGVVAENARRVQRIDQRSELLNSLFESERASLKLMNELAATLRQQQKQLAATLQHAEALHREQRRASLESARARRRHALAQRPLVHKLTRKSIKLLRNPERFFADSSSDLARTHMQRIYGAVWAGLAGEGAQQLAARKVAKLRRNPDAFVRDSKSPLVKLLGRWLIARGRTGASAPEAGTTNMGEIEGVRCSVVVAFPGLELKDFPELTALCDGLGAADELVLVTDSQHLSKSLSAWSKALSCKRARVYLFPEPKDAGELLAYGLDRAYGPYLVAMHGLGILAVPGAVSLAQRGSGHACIRRASDKKVIAVAAPRNDLRDARGNQARVDLSDLEGTLSQTHDKVRQLSTRDPGVIARGNADVHPTPRVAFGTLGHTSQVIERIAAIGKAGETWWLFAQAAEAALGETEMTDLSAAIEVIDLSAHPELFVYPMPSSTEPFVRGFVDAPVICIDRRPDWLRPELATIQQQRSRVSVIMTVFNNEKTVGAAIDSVLQQTYGNLELIVVDDCSSDGSLAVVTNRAKHDRRIRVVRAPKNSGTYWCKNYGLTFATGEFTTFHDADDVSLAPRLELQLGLLAVRKDAWATFVHYQRLSDSGHACYVGEHKDRTARITLMLRRSTLRTVGFFDSVRVAADDELLQRIKAAGGKVVRLPASYYLARHAAGSLTTAGATALILENNKARLPPVRVAYIEKAAAWHRSIRRDSASPFVDFPLRSRPFDAPEEIGGAAAHAGEQVTVSMATMPSRLGVLAKTVASLLPQVDRLNVYLNNFEEVPSFLSHPKITVARSQDHGDLKDNGKFFFMRQGATGYQLTVDDDIEYPPDYARRMILAIERYQRKAAIGVHGVNLDPQLERYTQKREVFHFKAELLQDRFVQLLGTGTLAFHASTLSVDYTTFETTRVVDLWFAATAKQKAVPLVALARPAEWLRALDHEGETIFAMAKVNDEKETQLARRLGPWTHDEFSQARRELIHHLGVASLDQAQATGIDVHEIARLRGLPRVRLEVLVTGWNCGQDAKRGLRSILLQEPGHYDATVRVLDDGSDDNTWQVLQNMALPSNVQLRRHTTNMGPAFSRWELLQEIRDPDAVCVLVDLDDELLPCALARVAQAYLVEPRCWLTSGNWRNQRGRPNPLDFYPEAVQRARAYRKLPSFRVGPLRSFRRFLANGLSDDLFKGPDGNWLMFCTDVALVFPLVEQCAPENIVTIRDHLYVYHERRPAGTIARFGKPRKAEVYRWLRNGGVNQADSASSGTR